MLDSLVRNSFVRYAALTGTLLASNPTYAQTSSAEGGAYYIDPAKRRELQEKKAQEKAAEVPIPPAAQIHPPSPEIMEVACNTTKECFNIGVREYAEKDFEAAMEYFRKSFYLNNKKERRNMLLYNMALTAEKAGNPRKAIELYRLYIERDQLQEAGVRSSLWDSASLFIERDQLQGDKPKDNVRKPELGKKEHEHETIRGRLPALREYLNAKQLQSRKDNLELANDSYGNAYNSPELSLETRLAILLDWAKAYDHCFSDNWSKAPECRRKALEKYLAYIQEGAGRIHPEKQRYVGERISILEESLKGRVLERRAATGGPSPVSGIAPTQVSGISPNQVSAPERPWYLSPGNLSPSTTPSGNSPATQNTAGTQADASSLPQSWNSTSDNSSGGSTADGDSKSVGWGFLIGGGISALVGLSGIGAETCMSDEGTGYQEVCKPNALTYASYVVLVGGIGFMGLGLWGLLE